MASELDFQGLAKKAYNDHFGWIGSWDAATPGSQEAWMCVVKAISGEFVLLDPERRAREQDRIVRLEAVVEAVRKADRIHESLWDAKEDSDAGRAASASSRSANAARPADSVDGTGL